MSYVAKMKGGVGAYRNVYAVSSTVYVELSVISRYAEAAGNNTPFCEHNSFKMDSQKPILASYINEVVNVFAELIVHYSRAGAPVFVL